MYRFLADDSQIDPAVVVVVEGNNAVGPVPIVFRQWNPLEGLALIVAPKGDRIQTPMREREVHPAIMVEVERRNAKDHVGTHVVHGDAR